MPDLNDPGSRLFDPITDTDRMRWQIHATTDLAQMLRDGQAAGLPAIAWMVTTTGGLSGTVLHTQSTTDRRAAFDTWVDHLGLTRWAERIDHQARHHLHAVGTLATRTVVGLTADVPATEIDHPMVDPTAEEC